MTEIRSALRYENYVDGIDVSQVQMIYSAQAVADAGFVFAMVKASEGTGYCDPKATTLMHQLRDVGLICNVYAFLRPSQGSPRLQVLKAYDCAGDIYPLRLALDLEGAPDTMDSAALVAFAEACIEETQHHGVMLPEIYSYPDFVRRRLMPALAKSATIGACPYWGADYGPTGKSWAPKPGTAPWFPSPPFATWTKWQYSGNDGFLVPGIHGACDRNLFNGNLAAFRRYMGFGETPTEPLMTVHPPVDFGDRRYDED